MKPSVIVGIILVLVGAILLGYGGFHYTKKEKVLDIGPLQATAETRERVPVPPVVSWALVGCGVVLIVVGVRRQSG